MSTHWNHPFHLVDSSPWPLTGAIRTITLVSGLIKWFHQYDISLFILGIIITLLTIYQW